MESGFIKRHQEKKKNVRRDSGRKVGKAVDTVRRALHSAGGNPTNSTEEGSQARWCMRYLREMFRSEFSFRPLHWKWNSASERVSADASEVCRHEN